MNENAITVPVRDINTIASEIRYIQTDVQQYAAAGALKIGERLCEAKELLGHGEFGPWLKDEFGWTDRTAQKLMAVYREFGDDQKSLFGPGINTNTYSDLPVSKLYLLISVPESEREEFVKENDIAEISVREMEKLLKEKKEAEAQAKESTDALEKLSGEYEALQAAYELDAEEAAATLAAYELDAKEAAAARAELERKAAAAREEGRAAAEKQLAEEMNTAKLNAEEAEAARKKAEEELRAALAEAERYKAESEKLRADPKVSEEKLREIEEKYAGKLKAAEAQAKLNDPTVAVFKVHFEAVQKEFAKMLELINAMDDERGGKLKAAVSAVLDGFRKELNG